MSDVSNQAGHFDPIHAAHAIEQVLFVIQTAQPLEDASFLEVRAAAMKFKNDSDFAGKDEIAQKFVFAFAQLGQVSSASQQQTGGFLLKSMRPDGAIEKELRVEANSVSFRTIDYTRWEDVWMQARRYFDALIPIYAAHAPITGINLTYVDKFIWRGNSTDCNPNLLLNPESKFLCPHVFEAKDFWHSHTGMFMRVDNNTKRLLNINVDYLEEERSDNNIHRIVSITTVMNDLFNQPGYLSLNISSEKSVDFLHDHMQSLHNAGKKIFGNIINDAMSKRIALTE